MGEVASEVSSYTCLPPRLRRLGAEGWGEAGVVRRRAGRGGWEDYSSRRAPRRLGLAARGRRHGPAVSRSSPGARVPTPRSSRPCCSWSLRRAQRTAQSLSLRRPPSPLARFLPWELLLFRAPPKRGRPEPLGCGAEFSVNGWRGLREFFRGHRADSERGCASL